jgi:hypothetical protein
VLKDILDLPGELAPEMELLPRSHLKLLEWVLGEDNEATRTIDAIYKSVELDLKELKEKRAESAKVPCAKAPPIC